MTKLERYKEIIKRAELASFARSTRPVFGNLYINEPSTMELVNAHISITYTKQVGESLFTDSILLSYLD